MRAMAVVLLGLLVGCTTPGAPRPPQLPEFSPGYTRCLEPRPTTCSATPAATCGVNVRGGMRSFVNACRACATPTVEGYVTGACGERERTTRTGNQRS